MDPSTRPLIALHSDLPRSRRHHRLLRHPPPAHSPSLTTPSAHSSYKGIQRFASYRPADDARKSHGRPRRRRERRLELESSARGRAGCQNLGVPAHGDSHLRCTFPTTHLSSRTLRSSSPSSTQVNGSVTVFGPLLVKSIGYTSLQATLLLTPGGATTCIAIYLFALLATLPRLARIPYARTGLLVLSCLPPIIGACMCWKGDWGNKAVPLAGYYLLPTFGAPFVLLLGWSTANVKGGTKQAIASGAIFVGYNLVRSPFIL